MQQTEEKCVVDTPLPRYLITDPAAGWMLRGRDLFISFTSFCANAGWKGRSQDGDLLMLGPESVLTTWKNQWGIWLTLVCKQLIDERGFQMQPADCLLSGWYAPEVPLSATLVFLSWFCTDRDPFRIFCEHSSRRITWLPSILVDVHPRCSMMQYF